MENISYDQPSRENYEQWIEYLKTTTTEQQQQNTLEMLESNQSRKKLEKIYTWKKAK